MTLPLIVALWANHLWWSLFFALALLLHKFLFVIHARAARRRAAAR